VQDSHSRSSQGDLLGLFLQIPPHPQGELVRCVVGEIFDVSVDLRRSSSSFANGCLTLSERCLLWDNQPLLISWPDAAKGPDDRKPSEKTSTRF
jgi:hypothetical protein